jgi:hypothetical protein
MIECRGVVENVHVEMEERRTRPNGRFGVEFAGMGGGTGEGTVVLQFGKIFSANREEAARILVTNGGDIGDAVW